MTKGFFTQYKKNPPTIYTYELIGVSSHEGLTKVGYTDCDVETLIKKEIIFVESMICPMEITEGENV